MRVQLSECELTMEHSSLIKSIFRTSDVSMPDEHRVLKGTSSNTNSGDITGFNLFQVSKESFGGVRDVLFV